jgi:hypothetical protein
MKKYFITHKVATPYHPQTSGVVQIIILASARIVCNIAFGKCEVDPTRNCVVKINLYSN